MGLQLRIILLLLGLLILMGVAFDTLRRRKRFALQQATFSESDLENIVEPELDVILEPELSLDLNQSALLPETKSNHQLDLNFDTDTVVTQDAVSHIAIFIMARDPNGYSGAQLQQCLINAGLHLGKNNTFYRYANDDAKEDSKREKLFSLVKAYEPGYFDPDTLAFENILGVTLILMPDAVKDPLQALDKMIRIAKQLAYALNGELLDQERKPLTLDTINNYKLQIHG